MRHRKHTFKIHRTSPHRRAMLANMTSSLLVEGQIKTTVVRAKELRRVVDRMITLGKRDTLAARRRAEAFLRRREIVRILFNDVAPKFADRHGGYTRILRLGQRGGDAAEMCLVQLVYEAVAKKETSPEAAETEPADNTAATEDAVDEPVAEAAEEASDEEESPDSDTDEMEEEEEKAKA